MPEPAVIIRKYQALGNDFLVAMGTRSAQLSAEEAKRWCDRRRGVGADGLLLAIPGDGEHDQGAPDIRMMLFNADGSRAQMSGNGIRCLVHAVVDDPNSPWAAAPHGEVRVLTDAGLRTVCFERVDEMTLQASVDMGAGRVEELTAEFARVDVGNPHLVFRRGDVVTLGRQHPDANVEVITVRDEQHLDMVVHERGVGLTEACGTGACASALAAHAWELVASDVDVHMPGGTAHVQLNEDRLVLSGPSTYIATIELPA